MTTTSPQVLLGFDFGMKRIGIAVGQMITQTARALTTLSADQGMPQWKEVDKIVKTWYPDALVVGIPLNMDGTEQPLTEAARQFVRALEDRFKLPVYGIDERLTTKAAREQVFNQGGYKALQGGQIDSIAAQLILQNWISMQSHADKKE